VPPTSVFCGCRGAVTERGLAVGQDLRKPS